MTATDTTAGETARPAPPPFEPQYPLCGLCAEEVEHNGDNFVCEACGIYWNPQTGHTTPGEWSDPDLPQCRARLQPWKDNPPYPDLADKVVRCILPARHEGGEHRNPDGMGWEWTDRDRLVIDPVCVECDQPTGNKDRDQCGRCVWNDEYPVGTRVRYWPMERTGPGIVSRTRSEAWTLGHGAAVVKVDGYSGGIALTHVQPDEGQ